MSLPISVIIPTIKPYFSPEEMNIPLGVERIIIHDTKRQGAPWARNKGITLATQPFLFFCDDDVVLENDALQVLLKALEDNQEAAYSYGWFLWGERTVGKVPWTPERLRQCNFVTTMSLVRTFVNPQWDESIQRLQDWDLWLTLLGQGHTGVFVDRLIFKTPQKNGITYGGIDMLEATRVVRKKHGLP